MTDPTGPAPRHRRSRPRARPRPGDPGHVPGRAHRSRRTRPCPGAGSAPWRHAAPPSRPSRSTTTGRASRTVRGPRGGPPSSARPTAQFHPQVHDRPFALRVDGRVGDLGERLAQVVGDGTIQPAAAGRRRVVAHAPERLVGLERHRLDVETGTFGVQAGQVAQLRGQGGTPFDRSPRRPRRGRRGGDAARRGSAGLRSAQAFASASSRIACRRGSTSSSWPGPSRPRRTVSAAVNGIAPASEATPMTPVRRDRERGRPQAVAVDQRPDPLAVREDDGRRAVPRRKEAGGPATPGRDVRVRGTAQGRGLGDRGDQGRRQRPAGRRQQFEGFVEGQRVGAVRGEERPGGQEVRGHTSVRAGVGGPSADLLAVAADRVDLAVVGDRAERLGEPPDRVRVGRVPLVEDRVVDRQRALAGPGRGPAAGRPRPVPCRRWSGTTTTGWRARRPRHRPRGPRSRSGVGR